MKDWRGNEIEVGSKVLYVFNTSTSVIHIIEGIVVELPPLEGRLRTPRAKIRMVRTSLMPMPLHWAEQIVKTTRLTVVHDSP